MSAMEKRLDAAKANPVGVFALQNLARRVETLESRAAPSAGSASSGTAAAPAGDADDDTHADGSRRYVRFDAPERALSVRQLENGAISVTNTDPSLTNRTVVIKAITDSGTVHDLVITVPAPPAP